MARGAGSGAAARHKNGLLHRRAGAPVAGSPRRSGNGCGVEGDLSRALVKRPGEMVDQRGVHYHHRQAGGPPVRLRPPSRGHQSPPSRSRAWPASPSRPAAHQRVRHLAITARRSSLAGRREMNMKTILRHVDPAIAHGHRLPSLHKRARCAAGRLFGYDNRAAERSRRASAQERLDSTTRPPRPHRLLYTTQPTGGHKISRGLIRREGV